MANLFTAELKPGRYLGFLILGASLHDVLTRLKAEPQRFPHIQLLYSPSQPITEPVRVSLPQNGMRLCFDGPEQRLRLIEILDFGKNHITFNDRDLVRPGETMGRPTFKHIYNRLFGPTYEGEFIANADSGAIYVLSYPGVAFNFQLTADECEADTGAVTLLAKKEATSMAIFSGPSWAESRPTLWTEVLPSCKVTGQIPKSKDVFPDEVSLARLHGGGKVELQRKWQQSTGAFVIQLGETTPQDLVRELGPPSAIYRKNDQRMVIHKMRTAASDARDRPSHTSLRPEELTDTDHSSMNTGSEEDSDEEAMTVEDGALGNPSGECFYNYFYLGFDVLLSTPVSPSPAPPGQQQQQQQQQVVSDGQIKTHHPDRLVATKIVLHGNIPGSYEFNRHRRLRWEVAYLGSDPITSESPFADVEARMGDTWKQHMSERGGKGMVLNRGWGDSPGSSCELLGGWEDSSGRIEGSSSAASNGDSTTTLFGFPGMVFEVLRNGFVNTVTVF